MELARRFARTGTYAIHDNLVIAVNALLCSLYDVFRASGRWLTDDAKLKVVTIGNQLGMFYQRLYVEATHAGRQDVEMTPKLHLLQELLCYQALMWGNPSYYWTYGDEDLVGTMIEIATSCRLNTLVVTAIMKWLIVCFDEIDQDEEE